jgi:hypothetical protein
MTHNVMVKRKRYNPKPYMVWQTMEWLREKGVIRKSIHGMTENVMAKRKKCNQKQYMV